MLRLEGAPAHLRRPAAGKALALRTRRQTLGSHLQLACISNEQLPEAQARPAEEIPRRAVGVTAVRPLDHNRDNEMVLPDTLGHIVHPR